MKDYVVITYIIALATSIPLIVISIFTLRKQRSQGLIIFIEFNGAIFVNVVLNAYFFYNLNMERSVNVGGFPIQLLTFTALAIFIHSIPLLLSKILSFKPGPKLKTLFHANGIMVLFLTITNCFLPFFRCRDVFISVVSYLLLLLTIAVIVGILFHKRIQNEYIKKGFISYAVLHIILCNGFFSQLFINPRQFINYNDFWRLFSLSSLPLFYALLNIALLVLYTHYLTFSRTLKNPEREIQQINISLSNREKEVAALLLAGHSYQAIGEKLFIAKPTVKTHINNIYKKTNTNNKIQLLNFINDNKKMYNQN